MYRRCGMDVGMNPDPSAARVPEDDGVTARSRDAAPASAQPKVSETVDMPPRTEEREPAFAGGRAQDDKVCCCAALAQWCNEGSTAAAIYRGYGCVAFGM